MSEYTLSHIKPGDKRAQRQMDALLHQEGIERDKNLDYSVGLFDENYELVGTGSCFGNTLRCLAIFSDHQGDGLLNQIISHLIEYQYSRGNTHLFLYTKCDTARFFGDLGFYEIARVDGKVVFMENRRSGFSDYLNHLKEETRNAAPDETIAAITGTNVIPDSAVEPDTMTSRSRIGAVIMNANPFTLGHQYLLEQAAAQVNLLHVFVVSEDVSLVPLSVREQLVKEGSAHLPNLIYHQTGPYMISNATFPSYFLKDSDTVIRSHAKLDIQIFTRIGKALGITDRFVGEEPFSQVTGIYNQVMKEELDASGIRCTILSRKSNGNEAISASAVRELLKDSDFDRLKAIVPESTLQFFTSPEAAPILERIRQTEEVRHY